MKKVFFALLAGIIASSSLAVEATDSPTKIVVLSTEHRNFARNFAMLAYAERRCAHLRVNALMLAQAVTEFGLPKGATDPGGAIFQEAQAEMTKLEGAFGSQSDEQFCSFMEDGFGPGGTIASGFLKRR